MKNRSYYFFEYFKHKRKENIQLFRAMKITMLFLTIGILSAFSANGFSQNARVTINSKNTDIEKILGEIEKQTDYLFIYNNKVELRQTASLSVRNQPVNQVLNKLFDGTSIQYTMEGTHIILHSNKKAERGTEFQTGDKTVKGKIVDAKGEPLIGVSVTVKGTTAGTVTDIDGNFTLKVPEGKPVEISYLGYTSQTKAVPSDASNFNIVMQEDNVSLDEVVVTALGIKRSQKALNYNVQEIKSDELTGVKDANFMNSLSGKVAGVTINTSASGVGGATRVVMRGTKSISKSNNALYVIDGIPIVNSSSGSLDMNNEYASQPGGEGISDLNPDDIESMTVLTGPAASALYGSNAANGAIVITTKKGIPGKPKVFLSNQTTFSRPFILPEFQNRYGNKQDEFESWGSKQDKYSYEPSDFFDTGVTSQTTASLSVGTEKNQTYMSLGTTTSSGIIPQNDYDKYNVTLRNTTNFLNDKFTLDFGFSYIKQKDRNMMAQGRYYNPLVPVYLFPRGENFDDVKTFEVMDPNLKYPVQQWKWGSVGLDMQNPYWIAYRNPMTNKKDRYMMNVSLKYNIFDWLNVVGRARLDNSVNNRTQTNYATTNTVFAPDGGRLLFYKEDLKQLYADLLANINKAWGDYNLTANIGTSISDNRSRKNGVDGGLIIPNFFTMANVDLTHPKTALVDGGLHEQVQSVFASVELGWRSMLYLTLTGRNDWASALVRTKTNSFFYPSIGLSGVLSEMVEMPKAISFLKVRGSFSSVGSPIPANLSIRTYPFSTQGHNWEIDTYKPVTVLKPERTDSWEFGFNSKFLGNKLTLDFTWYKSNTKNQTLNIPLSVSSGYKSMYVQTGNVQNQGLEIALGSNNQWGNFEWNSTFTAGYNKNEIKQLAGDKGIPDGNGNYLPLEWVSQGGIGSSEYRLVEGGTMGDLYVKKRLKRNEDGTLALGADNRPILENETEKVGSVLPKWNLGFRNGFSYKAINLEFLIAARLGGIVMSPTQAILDGYGVSEASAAARDRGGVPNGNDMIDAQQYYSIVGQAEGPLKDYVYSATNVRLQELSIGYSLPKKWFRDLMKVNLSLVGRNLWMIYNKAPFDPESVGSTGTYFQGIDYFMQPSQRSFGFSVKVEL